jgi:hypothetical protein
LRFALRALFVVTTFAASTHAQQPSPPPPTPAKQAAIGHLASEVAQALGQVPAGAVVVASPIASDTPTPKGDELAVRIATQIAGRLATARAHPQAASLAVARGLSGRAASLVHVQLEIKQGTLRATADLYPVVSNGWERLRNPVPGPRAHGFASVALDAEVRSFMAPVPLEKAEVHKAKHEEVDVVAVGCGDVDQDGGLELVIVSRSRVALGKLRAGKFVASRTTPWGNLASRSPTPLREPIASAIVSPRARPGDIFLGSTDRGSIVVDAMLVTKRVLTGVPIPGTDGDACAVPNADSGSFDGNAVTCTVPTKGEPAAAFPAPVSRYDAIAAFELVGKDGSLADVVAAREPIGKLRLRRSERNAAAGTKPLEATIDGVGAQVAVGDLDLDGVPEIVTTTEGADDVLAITTWNAKGTLLPRLRVPAKDGVRAVAVCPPEEKGVPAVVAVVGTEVWLVR